MLNASFSTFITGLPLLSQSFNHWLTQLCLQLSASNPEAFGRFCFWVLLLPIASCHLIQLGFVAVDLVVVPLFGIWSVNGRSGRGAHQRGAWRWIQPRGLRGRSGYRSHRGRCEGPVGRFGWRYQSRRSTKDPISGCQGPSRRN